MTLINTYKKGQVEVGESSLDSYEVTDGMYLAIRTNTWADGPNGNPVVHLDVTTAQTLIGVLQQQVDLIKANNPTLLRKQAFGLFKVVFGDVPAAARHAYTRAVLGLTPQADASWREGNLKPTQMRHVVRTLQAVCEAEDLVAEAV